MTTVPSHTSHTVPHSIQLPALMAASKAWQAKAKTLQREAALARKTLAVAGTEQQKWGERDRAEHEVRLYENRLALALSMHEECSEPRDWAAIVEQADVPDGTRVHVEPSPEPTAAKR